MSELFHAASGEWNQPPSGAHTGVATKPGEEEAHKGNNGNTFGAEATTPSAAAGGHGQLVQPEETSTKTAEHDDKVAEPKKTNPFV